MIEIARQKNATPLPLIPEKFGPRIPPERYCLTANNYKVKERQKPVCTHILLLPSPFMHCSKSCALKWVQLT